MFIAAFLVTFLNRWTYPLIVVYKYHQILLSDNKIWTTDIPNNIVDSQNSSAEWKKTDHPPQKKTLPS